MIFSFFVRLCGFVPLWWRRLHRVQPSDLPDSHHKEHKAHKELTKKDFYTSQMTESTPGDEPTTGRSMESHAKKR